MYWKAQYSFQIHWFTRTNYLLHLLLQGLWHLSTRWNKPLESNMKRRKWNWRLWFLSSFVTKNEFISLIKWQIINNTITWEKITAISQTRISWRCLSRNGWTHRHRPNTLENTLLLRRLCFNLFNTMDSPEKGRIIIKNLVFHVNLVTITHQNLVFINL